MKLNISSDGFTLIEVLLALGITALVASLFTSVTFEVIRSNTRINNRLVVVNDLQNAARWLYLDVERAETTDLIDEAPAVNSMQVNWTSSEVAQQSDYYLSDTKLIREHSGNQVTVARNVSDVGFSISGRLIMVNITSSSSNNDITKQATYLIDLKTSE